MAAKHERRALADFSERYGRTPSAGTVEVERRVIGAVWGANGYTTVTEADSLGDRLELSTNSRLLDVGTGCGWPGLYLGARHGCEVVVTDLPVEGLRVARARARREGIDLAGAAVASAVHLPLAASVFDAIVHTDVLC